MIVTVIVTGSEIEIETSLKETPLKETEIEIAISLKEISIL